MDEETGDALKYIEGRVKELELALSPIGDLEYRLSRVKIHGKGLERRVEGLESREIRGRTLEVEESLEPRVTALEAISTIKERQTREGGEQNTDASRMRVGELGSRARDKDVDRGMLFEYVCMSCGLIFHTVQQDRTIQCPRGCGFNLNMRPSE